MKSQTSVGRCITLILLNLLFVGLISYAAESNLVQLPVKFPTYSFKGGGDILSGPDIEKCPQQAPDLPWVPNGVTNVALHKPVKVSTNLFEGCRPEQVTDGEKEPLDQNIMEMRKGLQWVQVDLMERY